MRRRTIGWLTGLLAFCLLLAGCGGGADQTNPPHAPNPPKPSAKTLPNPALHWNPVVAKTVNDLRFYNDEIGFSLRESIWKFRIVAEHVNHPDFPTTLVQTWISQDGGMSVDTAAHNRGDKTGTAGIAAVSIRTPENEWMRCPTPEALNQSTTDPVKLVTNFTNRTTGQLQSMGCIPVGQ